MYQDPNMLASIRKVEAAREENIKLDPRRMTAGDTRPVARAWSSRSSAWPTPTP